MSLGSIVVRLSMNTADFDTDTGRAAKIAERRAKEIDASFRKASLAIGTVLAAGVGVFINNTMKAQQTVAQLDAILASTGEAAGYTRDQLISMAEMFQNESTFGKNEIIEAQTRLLSYSGVLGENIPRAMQTIMDQSARLGMSLTQSAETIGRALESPAKAAAALSDQGFGAAFTKEVRGTIDALVAAGREADAQILILEILEESYGGAAKAARDTFGGAMSALKNTLTDLMTGDEASLGGVTDAINALNVALSDPATKKAVSDLYDGIAAIANAIGPVLREAMDGARIGIKSLTGVLDGAAYSAIATADALYRLTTLDFSGFRRALEEIDTGRARAAAALFADYSVERVDPMFAGVTGGVNRGRRTVTNLPPPLTKPTKARSGKSDEEREAERLQKAYESLMGSMHQRIALFDAEGEAARVRYETEYGGLMALDPLLKQQAILRAQELDQMEQVRKEGEARMRMAEEETKRIRDGLEYGKEVLKDLQFELELMRMGNAERATAIQLRGMESESIQEYGEAIAQANRDIEASMREIALMDGARDSFATFFEDVIGGTKSVKDAFGSMLEDINRMILRRIAENWVEQLFGAFGTNQSGSAGGNWMQMFAGMFGGGRAVGGGVSAGRLFKVNERGVETLRIPGREDFLMTGNAAGQVLPNQRGGGQFIQNVTIPVSGAVDRRTKAQVASDVGRMARLATARNG